MKRPWCIGIVALQLASGVRLPAVLAAEEPTAAPAAPSLQEQIHTYETLGQQITELQARLPQARGADRRRLETTLRELQAAQDRAFDAIERVVGPLPPAVRPEPAIPLEDQLRARHRRDDAALERDVDRRLPRN
ncbi:MAG: hypothetical protein HY600_03295 [Candidatus Omnitrophica bacterium]|nr:hypothetical protein [Candidatus Omnitrophota bacterium]